MPVHLVIRLPDGRQAWIDSREPIAGYPAGGPRRGAAQRIMACLADRRDPDPGDLAEVAAWLDANAGQSELCRVANPVLNGVNCGHFPEGPGPSVCVSGCCLAHRRETYWNIQDRAWVHTDGWPCEALAGLPAMDAAGRPVAGRSG